MNKLSNNIFYGSDAKQSSAQKSSPKREAPLGKRARDEEDTPESKRKRIPVSPIKHNFRTPKEPGYYR